jgi:hypothetical protein
MRRMPKQRRQNLILGLPNLQSELMKSYINIGFKAALLYPNSINWYEFASYTIEEKNGTFSEVRLHLDDFITINEEEFGESYAIIKGIFRHKGNNQKYYAFIVINWFEDANQEHPVLKCSLYHLRTIENQRWRRIFPISAIDSAQKVHFIHNCTNLECQDHYNNANRIWIKNNYYFTAI